MKFRTVALRVIATVLTLALASAACGISGDEDATQISTDLLPVSLQPLPPPTPTTEFGFTPETRACPDEADPDAAEATEASSDATEPAIDLETCDAGPGVTDQIFMIQDDNLVPVVREFANSTDELIETLLEGTRPEEADMGIQTAISRGTEVTSLEVNEELRLVTVDLAPGSLDVRNSEQRFAFAQIVYTLTAAPGIDTVEFKQSDPSEPTAVAVDLAVQTDNGTSLPGERVSRESFASLDPERGIRPPSFEVPTPVQADPNAAPTFSLSVWMVQGGELVKVPRTLERSQKALIASLLEGPSADEVARGISSALPPDAFIKGVTTEVFDVAEVDADGFETLQATNIAIVDLAPGSLPGPDMGEARFIAAAQIVFTLTELVEVDQVVFAQDGAGLAMARDGQADSLAFDPNLPNGLDRNDYVSLIANVVPGLGISPSPTPTPTATVTPTPAPTSTPAPDSTLTPTPVPTAIPTP